MIKRILITFESMQRLLHLPSDVAVVASRQNDQGVVEFTVVDNAGTMPEHCTFDEDKKEWVKCPPMKGKICGELNPLAEATAAKQ